MTKEEQNQIIKDTWMRNLRKETELPDNIGSVYRSWVIGKVRQAGAQLQKPAEEQPQEEAN